VKQGVKGPQYDWNFTHDEVPRDSACPMYRVALRCPQTAAYGVVLLFQSAFSIHNKEVMGYAFNR
jgi:hypothetical protein